MHSLRSLLWVWLISPKCTAVLFASLSVLLVVLSVLFGASCKVSYCAVKPDEYDEFMTGCLQNVDRGDAVGECGRRATFLGYAARVDGECPAR
jgi:hypothetical protein